MKTLKYSRQRESIKTCLMSRYDHPTADELYMSIRNEFPNISLGTVYRNLNLLVELGEIRKLNYGDGPDHFDADVAPHYHFVCKGCAAVLDLPMEPLQAVNETAAECLGCRVDSHDILFTGICPDCLKKQNN